MRCSQSTFKRIFIAFKIYIRKEEISQINNLKINLKVERKAKIHTKQVTGSK